MPAAVEVVPRDLTKELTQLMTSGENWQIVLHGGKTGDVMAEVKRTRKLRVTQKVLDSLGAVLRK